MTPFFSRLSFPGVVFCNSKKIFVRFNSSNTPRIIALLENVSASSWWRKTFLSVRELYDEVTGLKEVRDAQNRVLTAENQFVLAQDERRKMQLQLSELQRNLKAIHAELDKTPRGEERYIQLITLEHAVLKREKAVNEIFHKKEEEERGHFSALSSAVKMSHEKERAQAERTKYWSIIGSVFGTLLGIVASTIINQRRLREIKDVVEGGRVFVHKDTGVQNDNLRETNKKVEMLVNSVKKMEMILAHVPKQTGNSVSMESNGNSLEDSGLVVMEPMKAFFILLAAYIFIKIVT